MGHASQASAAAALQCPGRPSPELLHPPRLTGRTRTEPPAAPPAEPSRPPSSERARGSRSPREAWLPPGGRLMLQAVQRARYLGKCP